MELTVLPSPLPLLVAFFVAAGGGGAENKPKGGAQETEATKAARWLEGRSGDQQRKLAELLRTEVDALGDPWLAAVRAAAIRAAAFPKKTLPEAKSKASPEGALALARELPFPIHHEYVFGARAIRPALDAQGKTKDAKAVLAEDVAAALRGLPPDLDLAFAGSLADLDRETSADDFALFLESWRNGEESFYRALDRTAGTPKEVFFYDVMLGDFTQKFMAGVSIKTKGGLAAAHDALHNGFLTYRQYRALREAYALSLLLPPEAPLPKNLARYEQAPEGRFSVRDDAAMLLALAKGDLAPPLALAVSTAKPMPAPLWSGSYEPVAPLLEAFGAKLGEVNAAFGSPQNALAKARGARQQLSEKVAAAARRALRKAGCPAFKDAP